MVLRLQRAAPDGRFTATQAISNMELSGRACLCFKSKKCQHQCQLIPSGRVAAESRPARTVASHLDDYHSNWPSSTRSKEEESVTRRTFHGEVTHSSSSASSFQNVDTVLTQRGAEQEAFP